MQNIRGGEIKILGLTIAAAFAKIKIAILSVINKAGGLRETAKMSASALRQRISNHWAVQPIRRALQFVRKNWLWFAVGAHAAAGVIDYLRTTPMHR